MLIQQLDDLQDYPSIRRAIVDHQLQQLAPQMHSLVDQPTLEANLDELLVSLAARQDRAILCWSPPHVLAGFALLTDHLNTWTNAPEGFIYMLGVLSEPLHPPLAALLSAIQQLGRLRGWHTIRAELHERQRPLATALLAQGWSNNCLIPCMILPPPTAAVSSPTEDSYDAISIRPARAEDYPIIYRLLAEATWDGLSRHERSLLDRDALQQEIRDEFAIGFSEGAYLSLVAEREDGTVCGHVTAQIACTHPLLALPEAEIIDVFVLPNSHGRSVGGRLTAQILSACEKREISLVRSTLVLENTPLERIAHVRDTLEWSGWWFSSVLMYIHLDAQRSHDDAPTEV